MVSAVSKAVEKNIKGNITYLKIKSSVILTTLRLSLVVISSTRQYQAVKDKKMKDRKVISTSILAQDARDLHYLE